MENSGANKELLQITKLEVQQKKKNRCSVYLDTVFAFGISVDLVVQFGLKKGRSLSEAEIADIQLEESKRHAKDRAIRFLSFRDRSEKEVVDKLRSLKLEDPVINWVMDELKRMQLIDDQRFARAFAQNKMITKPMGEYLLRRELTAKGITEVVAQQAIDQIYQEYEPVALAKELAIKQAKKNRRLEPVKLKKRVSDFLLRRGFGWDIIHDVMDELNIEDNFE